MSEKKCDTCIHQKSEEWKHLEPTIYCGKNHWRGVDNSEAPPDIDHWADCTDYSNSTTPDTPTAQWQKCGEDCDCKDECKQLVADTPQIMQELSNRDKWQKEAEETSPVPKDCWGIQEGDTIIKIFFFKDNAEMYKQLQGHEGMQIVPCHIMPAAHLAQLQGEIDVIGSSIAELLAIYGENIPLKHSEELVSLLTRLRTITQTKTDKG